MPYHYGKSRSRLTKTSFGTSRFNGRSAAKKKQSAARKRVVAKTRKAPVKAIVRNTRAIKRLREESYGTVQYNTGVSGSFHVMADHPVLHHINNLNMNGYQTGDQQGPEIYRINGTHAEVCSQLMKSDHGTQATHLMTPDILVDRPNGPILKHMRTRLTFQVDALVNDAHVTIQIIRQKKMPPWGHQQDNINYLPAGGAAFKRLAGPMATNQLDPKTYEVCATRKIYINSKGRTTAADHASAHQYSSYPTTNGIKHCVIDFKPNKVYKQLDTAIDQITGNEDFDVNVTTNHQDVAADMVGSWSYDNIHPLANYWVLITCDKHGNPAAALTGSEVSVTFKRENWWRDKIA